MIGHAFHLLDTILRLSSVEKRPYRWNNIMVYWECLFTLRPSVLATEFGLELWSWMLGYFIQVGIGIWNGDPYVTSAPKHIKIEDYLLPLLSSICWRWDIQNQEQPNFLFCLHQQYCRGFLLPVQLPSRVAVPKLATVQALLFDFCTLRKEWAVRMN